MDVYVVVGAPFWVVKTKQDPIPGLSWVNVEFAVAVIYGAWVTALAKNELVSLGVESTGAELRRTFRIYYHPKLKSLCSFLERPKQIRGIEG